MVKTNRYLCALCGLAAFLLPLGPAPTVADAWVVKDTFEDDSVGQPPNGAEVGTAEYYAEPGVTYVVVSDGSGNQSLQANDRATDQGILITYTPNVVPEDAQIGWDMRIEDGAAISALNDFGVEAVLSPLGTNVDVWFSNTGYVGVRVTVGGYQDELFQTPYAWSTGTDYSVLLNIAGSTDSFDLLINGSPVVTNHAINNDVTAVRMPAFYSSIPTTGTMILDNVTMTPEPATLCLLVLGLPLLSRKLRRTR